APCCLVRRLRRFLLGPPPCSPVELVLLFTPRRPPTSTLFPYTTLFRSVGHDARSSSTISASTTSSSFGSEVPPAGADSADADSRSEEHTSELQSLAYLVCRLLLEKKKSIQQRFQCGRRGAGGPRPRCAA